MREEYKHIEFYKNLDVQFNKTEDELFNSILAKTKTIIPKSYKRLYLKEYAIASIIIILLGISLFFSLYTKTIYSPKGKHYTLILPDNSKIELNADTKISYKPIWWMFKREINFEGEAFFEIKKGSHFEINSTNGKTEILGTSFNIYSRKNEYKVFCKTGKVKVSSILDEKSYTIKAGEIVRYKKNKSSKDKVGTSSNEIIHWRDNIFSFSSENLSKVIEEIELQFDVEIWNKVPDSLDYNYTGLFNKNMNIEQTLNILSKSFNISYKKINEKEYQLY
jgi:ferric-dicitrate binding protein FerR (iron transport regulator)